MSASGLFLFCFYIYIILLRKKKSASVKGVRQNTLIFLHGSSRCFLYHYARGVQIWQRGFLSFKDFPSAFKKTKNHAYRGLGYEVLINCLEYNLNRVLPVLYLYWLCPSSGHRKTSPAISRTARSWTETGGKLSPMFFSPMKPRYQRVESQQEMGPRVDGECANWHLENLGIVFIDNFHIVFIVLFSFLCVI